MTARSKLLLISCIALALLAAVLGGAGSVPLRAATQAAQAARPLAPALPQGRAAQGAQAPTGTVISHPQGIPIITNTPTRTPTPINIGNFVWDDLDQDGIQDAGEPGIAGITVELRTADKNGLIASTVTNASGLYTVVAPVPGDYRVRVVLASPLDHFTDKLQGGDTQRDSNVNPSGTDFGFTDVFTLASNVISITTIDAGIVVYRPPTPTRTPTPIHIGNFVWNDLNANGVQDAGEPGVPGVTVELRTADKNGLIASAVTNASGIYSVVAPVPGDYRVRVIPPLPGGVFSPKGQGTTLTDSNVNPTGPDFGFTDVFTLASNVISITTIDAGLINLPATLPTATPTNTSTPTNTPQASATPTATLTPTTNPLASATPASLNLPVIVR
jgi:hypothetical protein